MLNCAGQAYPYCSMEKLLSPEIKTKKLPVRLTSNNTETARDSNTNQYKVFCAISAGQVENSCMISGCFVREI